MKSVLLISTLLLVGCGQGFNAAQVSDPRTIQGIDPVFKPYIEKYLAYKGIQLYYDIPVQFSPDLGGNTVGLCTRWSSGQRQVQIDKDYWDNYLTEGEKYEVIAHELGHCDLNRDHTLHFSNPISIMDPYVFELLPSTIASYMQELFNPTSSTLASNDDHEEFDCVKDIEVK